MADIVMPALSSKENLRQKLSKMSPSVRDEIINEGRRSEILDHIREDKEGYSVDLIHNKKFTTIVDAELEVKKLFNENPRLSNFSDLEK